MIDVIDLRDNVGTREIEREKNMAFIINAVEKVICCYVDLDKKIKKKWGKNQATQKEKNQSEG